MKYSLLEMTQDIMSNMSSDEVNSISDTPESMQVATIIKQKYYDIVSRGDLPEHNQLFQLLPSMNSNEPVLMFIPDGVGRVEYIKYYNSNPYANPAFEIHNTDPQITALANWSTNSTSTNTIALGSKTFTVPAGLSNIGVGNNCVAAASTGTNEMFGTVTSYSGTTLIINVTEIAGSGTYSNWSITQGTILPAPPGYQYVTMLPIKQFLDHINTFDPTSDDVEVFTFSDTSNNYPGNYTFLYKNDNQPQFCCILSNYYVIFDSYDVTQDSTLQGDKTMCFGQVVPTFQMVDTFIPDLDSQQFPLLLNEAKALAFYELKQMPHAKAEQEIKRQWSTVQKNKSLNNKPNYFDQFQNYGRLPPYGRLARLAW